MTEIGKQYGPDDEFKAAARLHQSKFRAEILKVPYDEYGNRLTEPDARALLNYFDGLSVRETLRSRFPDFQKQRDGDMLRSEHIPFNFLPPLLTSDVLAQRIIGTAFGIKSSGPFDIRLEFAPDPRDTHLSDATSFDGYIAFRTDDGKTVGIGIEVKFTEREYSIGKKEKKDVENPQSRYWVVTRNSGAFANPENQELKSDEFRQIWRNHLLGLSMCECGEIDDFYSITLFPGGNGHFQDILPRYREFLTGTHKGKVLSCAYENFIKAIDGDDEVKRWQKYLQERYRAGP